MRKFTIIASLFLCGISFAQQVPQSYMYTYNGFLINPAASGLQNCTEIGVSHHNQWVKIEGAPITNYFTITSKIGNRWGVGGQFMLDKIGMLQQISGIGNVSYGILSGNQSLRFGISLGYNNYRVNPSSAIAFDPLDPIVNGGNQSAGAITSDFGIRYKINELEIFGSVKQLLKTYSNFGYSNLQGYGQRAHFLIGSGYNFTINQNWNLRPNVLIKNINNVTQADINMDARYHKMIHMGLGFRTQVGLVARAGITLKEKFFFGYAYESPLANIASYSTGSHEMILKIMLCKPEKAPKIVKNRVDTVFREIQKIDTVLITKTEYIIDTVIIDNTIPVKETTPEVNTGSLTKTILFEFDKSLVRKNSFGELESIVNILNTHPEAKVSLSGHTDAVGTEFYNVGLSKNRVNAVRDFLIMNGIEENRILINHFGEIQPKTTNTTIEGRQDNRRVDVEIIR